MTQQPYRTRQETKEEIFSRIKKIMEQTRYPQYEQLTLEASGDDFKGFFGKRRKQKIKEQFIEEFLKPFSPELHIYGWTDEQYEELFEHLIQENKFTITETAEAYTINKIYLLGEICTVDISKNTLANAEKLSAEKWKQYRRKTEWKYPSTQLYFSIFSALYNHRDHKDLEQKKMIEKVRKMLFSDFDRSWMITSTTVYYEESGKNRPDTISHNFAPRKVVKCSMIGSDAAVEETAGLEKQMEAIFGTPDCAYIKKVIEYISEKSPFLWRLNAKPLNSTEKSVSLGGGIKRFDIDAKVEEEYLFLARGVIVRRQKLN
jgi:hypothetical protein